MGLLKQYYISLADSKWDVYFITALLVFEVVLTVAILQFVPYTEIDWKAYMQEVTMWEGGEKDYAKIHGDTGPLVYPAGFVYLFALFKCLTKGGKDLLRGQYIFCGIYVLQAFLVSTIYNISMRHEVTTMSGSRGKNHLLNCHKIWLWRVAMIITCLSKRIHSIFVLRLFNDGPCMTIFYLSLFCFARSYWKLGCAFFSFAVSIKMNILLFAPGLLLLLLQSSQNTGQVVLCLGICAVIQLILGAPFLLSFPFSYLRKAFEFDRVFFYQWTVNWKFLPESIFVHKYLSIFLLLLHLLCLSLFAKKWLQSCKNETGKRILFGTELSPTYIVQTLFLSNFIGITFARTLHYQFYSWYFHTLPFMLNLTNVPVWSRLLLIFMVEYAFNVFPATPFSSLVLQVAHFIILLALYRAQVPTVVCPKPIKTD